MKVKTGKEEGKKSREGRYEGRERGKKEKGRTQQKPIKAATTSSCVPHKQSGIFLKTFIAHTTILSSPRAALPAMLGAQNNVSSRLFKLHSSFTVCSCSFPPSLLTLLFSCFSVYCFLRTALSSCLSLTFSFQVLPLIAAACMRGCRKHGRSVS